MTTEFDYARYHMRSGKGSTVISVTVNGKYVHREKYNENTYGVMSLAYLLPYLSRGLFLLTPDGYVKGPSIPSIEDGNVVLRHYYKDAQDQWYSTTYKIAANAMDSATYAGYSQVFDKIRNGRIADETQVSVTEADVFSWLPYAGHAPLRDWWDDSCRDIANWYGFDEGYFHAWATACWADWKAGAPRLKNFLSAVAQFDFSNVQDGNLRGLQYEQIQHLIADVGTKQITVDNFHEILDYADQFGIDLDSVHS